MKVKVHSSSEPPLQYNQTPDAFYKTRPIDLLSQLRYIKQFQISSKMN